MKETLFSLIEKYDIITIYRHISADSDAMGSQFGLKTWIEDTYPEKHAYVLGNSVGSCSRYFPIIDKVEDEVVKQSLAIILDTANSSRIDDDRWKTASYRLKIDHHIFVEAYAETEIVSDYAGATCEILADLFQQQEIPLSKKCAEYLYGGIIADTLQFSIQATTPKMLRTAAYLLEAGVKVAEINRQNFSKTLVEFKYENYLRSHVTILENRVAYCKVTREEYEGCGLTLNQAKEKVYVLGNVDEFEAWALFIETNKTDEGIRYYNGSLRSKDKQITDLAMKYHGGGHRYACGVKNLTDQDIQSILEEFLNL